MLSLSLLCLPQKLLFLFRFLLCCCWWQLLLATLLVTRRNDGGAASNGEGRETRERDELLFFSPILLFFCSFLLFSRQLKSSPFCSSTLLSFSKILPSSSFLSFSKKSSPPGFLFSFSFPSLPFSSVLPELLSSQKQTLPSSCLFKTFRLPPLPFLLHLPCIYRQPGERHHTLSKCRAWWRGMAPVQPLQGMTFLSSRWGHGSPVSSLMRVWVV